MLVLCQTETLITIESECLVTSQAGILEGCLTMATEPSMGKEEKKKKGQALIAKPHSQAMGEASQPLGQKVGVLADSI